MTDPPSPSVGCPLVVKTKHANKTARPKLEYHEFKPDHQFALTKPLVRTHSRKTNRNYVHATTSKVYIAKAVNSLLQQLFMIKKSKNINA